MSVFCSLLLAGSAAQPPASVVAGIVGEWSSAPKKLPSGGVVDGPLLGNGDIGVVLANNEMIKATAPRLTWWLSSNQMWAAATTGVSQCGYKDASSGWGGLKQFGGLTLFAPTWTDPAFAAQQILANGTVTTSQPPVTTSSVVHPRRNMVCSLSTSRSRSLTL